MDCMHGIYIYIYVSHTKIFDKPNDISSRNSRKHLRSLRYCQLALRLYIVFKMFRSKVSKNFFFWRDGKEMKLSVRNGMK